MAWKVSKFSALSVFVTIALLVAYLSNFPQRITHRQPPPEPHVELPRYDVWGIRDLKQSVQIANLHLRVQRELYDPPLKQDLESSLNFVDVDLAEPLPNLPVLTTAVKIPEQTKVDASYLLFGLATTLGRLKDAFPAFALWASGTKARFVILVAPASPDGPSIEEITRLYGDHDISLTLIESEAGWYDQYVSLVAVLHDQIDERTRWACIMDDDTFFFSMDRLLKMLDKYSPKLPYYIGGLSENKETMDRLGYLAFGGAGIFLSLPLLKQLRPHVDECIKLPDDAGDMRLAACIYKYSTTKFTWEHYLFQMDLHGDVTGFYEAVRTRPVSTHHWKTWHHHDMVTVGAVSKVCGNECILQKYQLPDGWIMTNGFSIIKYSYSKEEEANWIEEAMEHTWADTAWVIPTSWNYTLSPLKPRDEKKIQYLIERVEEDEEKMTLYYVKRSHSLGEGIIRVFWEK